MKLWFFNVDEFLEHRVEVSALCAGKGAGDILPDAESGPNSDTCPSTTLLCISHLLYDPDLLHKKAGALSGKPGSCSGHTQVLAWAAAADDVHGREPCAVQLCDVSHMEHVGEMGSGYLDGKGLDLAGPDRRDPTALRCQWEASDAIKKASHRELRHLATACTTVFVVLTAA